MALKSEVDKLFGYTVNTGLIRQAVLPFAAGGLGAATAVPAVSPLFGAWSAVGVAADIGVPTLVVGFSMDAIGLLETYTIQLGNGRGFATVAALNAGGAPAVLAAARVTLRVQVISVIAAVAYSIAPVIMLPVPVLHLPGEFICARVGTAAGAAGGIFNLTAFVVTGF